MTFLDRYMAGDHVAVWIDLAELGEDVRREPYYSDAVGVAGETMRRVRQNVALLIRRLDARGYRFLDSVSSAENRLSRLDVMGQFSSEMEAWAGQNSSRLNEHSLQLLDGMRAMKANMAPLLAKAANRAAKEASVARRSPLDDSHVFSPPDKNTPRLLAELENAAGGPLPLSLRAWYEQVGGVSFMGSDSVLNPVDFSNRNVLSELQSLLAKRAAPYSRTEQDHAPDPLFICPLEELLHQASGGEGARGGAGHQVRLVISPDDLHKANVSGDAYYLTLPNAAADFLFDDWHHTTFVNYLRLTFQWGGFPGWERSNNPPRGEIAKLTEGLLAI